MARGAVQTTNVTITGAGNQTVAAALAGQRVVVCGYNLTLSAAMTLTFDNVAGTATLGSLVVAAAANPVYSGTPDAPAMQTAIGDGFRIVNSAGNVQGHICWYQSTG